MINAQLIEHIACFAAEFGHTELEDMCDSVLAGDSDEGLVLGVLAAARQEDVTDFDDLPTYVDYRPWTSRSRTTTIKLPYVNLEDEATAWVAEYRAARGA